jgi:broad specificity phosphatase PhoE
MRLYFVRHGESEANTRHIISNRGVPLGLTAIGRQQAKALAEKLREVPFRVIYCSPVLRARQTADILSASLGIPYEVAEALREYDCGILEERSDEESWKLHREYFESWTLHNHFQNKPEGGESFLDIQKRFLPFIENLTHDGAYKEKNFLLIGHGGLFHLMLPLLLINIDNEFVRRHAIGHADCVIAEWASDRLVCKQWSEVRF